jgi:uncharacterized protein YkwD
MRRLASLPIVVLAVLGCDPAPPSGEEWSAVPTIAYCNDARDWDPQWTELEEQTLALVNARRAEGADCRTAGNFAPSEPLAMDPALRCAARVHSADMDAREFFEHTNPSGESPFERMENAGYAFSTAGENIDGGATDAEAVMQQWMGSDGHCSNIMNPAFRDIGIGYHPGGEYGHLWTQTFAAPRSDD